MADKTAQELKTDRVYKILRSGLPMEESKELASEMSTSVSAIQLNQWEEKMSILKSKAADKSLVRKNKSIKPEALELAELLRSYVLELFPHYEKQVKISKWAEDIQKIPAQSDDFNFDTVKAVITWLFRFDTRDSEFWRKQVRSGANLRKHFMRLYDSAKDDFEDMKIDEV